MVLRCCHIPKLHKIFSCGGHMLLSPHRWWCNLAWRSRLSTPLCQISLHWYKVSPMRDEGWFGDNPKWERIGEAHLSYYASAYNWVETNQSLQDLFISSM